MRKPTAFLAHHTRITLILVALLCFIAAAEAQHGGGGGHSGGGHSGGGHSSGSHAGTGHADGHCTGGHLFGFQNIQMLASVVSRREPKMLRGSSCSEHRDLRVLCHG